MSGNHRDLKGEVTEGLFPSEALFLFRDVSGQEIALVAPSESVKGAKKDGSIRVRVIDTDGKLYLVDLPGEVYGATNQVTVREDQLQRA